MIIGRAFKKSSHSQKQQTDTYISFHVEEPRSSNFQLNYIVYSYILTYELHRKCVLQSRFCNTVLPSTITHFETMFETVSIAPYCKMSQIKNVILLLLKRPYAASKYDRSICFQTLNLQYILYKPYSHS